MGNKIDADDKKGSQKLEGILEILVSIILKTYSNFTLFPLFDFKSRFYSI